MSLQPAYYSPPTQYQGTPPHAYGPPPDPGYLGAEGGIIGAVSRVKQRKERAAWFETDAKNHPHKRPGQNADGRPDGTLGLKDIQLRLAIATDGSPPPEKEVLKLLMSPLVRVRNGRVAEDQMDTIIALYNSREVREPAQSSNKWTIDKKNAQQGCGCIVQ